MLANFSINVFSSIFSLKNAKRPAEGEFVTFPENSTQYSTNVCSNYRNAYGMLCLRCYSSISSCKSKNTETGRIPAYTKMRGYCFYSSKAGVAEEASTTKSLTLNSNEWVGFWSFFLSSYTFFIESFLKNFTPPNVALTVSNFASVSICEAS